MRVSGACLLSPYQSILVGVALQEELQGPGSLLGYRSMWQRLRVTQYLPVRRYFILINNNN